MLIRPHDRGDDEDEWRAFVQSQGFGHLAVNGADGIPVVVPTQFRLLNREVVLHLAAANPAVDALGVTPGALLSVAGDWSYIPGGWRSVGDDPTLGIPTTFYGAVQISGPVTVVSDPDGIAEILDLQTAALEPPGSLQPALVHRKKFPAIRGLRLAINEVRAKFKFGDNIRADLRASIAERLRERNGPGDAQAAVRIGRPLPEDS